MKDTQISTLSKKTFTYTILDTIAVDIEVTANPYQLPIEELFTMAARINKKRSFLFVSKVLGKHLPIYPQKGLLTAALLAARYAESIKGSNCQFTNEFIRTFSQKDPQFKSIAFIQKSINPVIIGFAETATALGHAFFDCFESGEYFHTTREEITSLTPSITFEEEHSHATSHRCYIPLNMIDNEREIILVDDEMTTGKTAVNIIQSIQAQFPRKEYTVVSILDWRSEENKQQFAELEKTLGITINIVSLMSGCVQVNENGKLQEQERLNTYQEINPSIEIVSLSAFFEGDCPSINNKAPLIKETGRFGTDSINNKELHTKISEASKVIRQHRTGAKTLCLGTGEFMYIPMKLAVEMGGNVFYQSTTRSPIYIQDIDGYGARHGLSFPNPEDPNVAHFVYNIPPDEYDELFVFFEREVSVENLQPLLNQVKKLKIKSIKIVFFSH
ncbi:phosphoribosyltransferase family protein [Neobacillus niacini]|jgi:Phosphoribosyl transferase/TRSP domain C terminus to PRTase_2|uniref:phosphoribosyltransferase family protein n=1 Tax=Neobacillus niacini TaxID=86668 RepID=UPI001C8D4C1D|nr:phosphoribosyltransferase family protein [Neobacillus niacini]MBY0145377.1 phosphoribosyltransferase family protein [Neobacillus niacini]